MRIRTRTLHPPLPTCGPSLTTSQSSPKSAATILISTGVVILIIVMCGCFGAVYQEQRTGTAAERPAHCHPDGNDSPLFCQGEDYSRSRSSCVPRPTTTRRALAPQARAGAGGSSAFIKSVC